MALAAVGAIAFSFGCDDGQGDGPGRETPGTAGTGTGGGRTGSEPAGGGEPSTGPGAAVDSFGVTMLYPTASGGETWQLSDAPMSDSRFIPQTELTRNEDGSWKVRNPKVRMQVATSTGYNPSLIQTYDREVLATRGYMQSPNDWRNVEMTGFVRVNKASTATDNFSWYVRGGKHSDPIACEGSAYKGGLHFDGKVRVEKESWHVNYDHGEYKNATSSLIGRWVGFKSVVRDVEANGKPAVKVELWLNDSGDKVTWEKVYELIDDGSIGGGADACGGKDAAMPILWGGPLAVYRWDGAEDVDVKWLSVREID